ncbi:hypothetical protein UFOVP228_29 [uncultured Caudovirales phage]|uniref:Uncharacterized protein n=1 Tax=uncultured Caudovirales phage TaxID=2100421 RepID=A0A6J5T8X0_9CAUD|nr:hypothetical protein UFOVP47_73 [uncultured Caudovirales phage]CAB5219134.1 hypothetical protein UFOVP228_29 [uncultured Caudovirales phage]
MVYPTVDELGNVYGRLTVIGRVRRVGRKAAEWVCKCTCGATAYHSGTNLRSGAVVSCGCYMKEIRPTLYRSHGLSKSKGYRNWATMVQRCTNTNVAQYKDYGGRGITVCKRWLKFENFYADMGVCPEGCSLERRDNMKGYSKSNCYWATRVQQAANKRNNVLLTANGETLPLTVWARRLGTCHATLRERIERGWSEVDTCTRPVRKVNNSRFVPLRGKVLHIQED